MEDVAMDNNGGGGPEASVMMSTTRDSTMESPFEIDEQHLQARQRPQSYGEYFCSSRFLEYCVTLVPLFIGLILEYGGVSPRMRPMPTSRLSTTDEILMNQTYDEEFDGEHISSRSIIENMAK